MGQAPVVPWKGPCFHRCICEQGLGAWGPGGWGLGIEAGSPPHTLLLLCFSLSDSLLSFLPPRCHFLLFSCPVWSCPTTVSTPGAEGTGGRGDSWGRTRMFLPCPGVSVCSFLLSDREHTRGRGAGLFPCPLCGIHGPRFPLSPQRGSLAVRLPAGTSQPQGTKAPSSQGSRVCVEEKRHRG